LVDALHEDEARISAAHALKELGPAAASAGEDLRQAYQQYSSLVDHAADAYALAGALKAVVPDAPELAGWLLPGRSADYRRVSMFTIFALCMVDATPTAATERLIEMLGSEDYTERSAPRRHLRNVGPEAAAAIPALIHMLGDNNIPLREWACEALGQIGPAAIPALLEALEDDRYLRRWSAPEALGYIGRPAVPALVRALDSEEGPVVAAALQAVGALGPEAEEALPTLRHMTRSHPKSHVRQLSALVIEKIATR